MRKKVGKVRVTKLGVGCWSMAQVTWEMSTLQNSKAVMGFGEDGKEEDGDKDKYLNEVLGRGKGNRKKQGCLKHDHP